MSLYHVLGVGSIGGLFAKHLHKAGARVTLLTHRNNQPASRRIRYIFHQDHYEDIVFPQIKSSSVTTNIEYLLVTTKAYHVEKAIDDVISKLTDHSVVIVLANGMGYHDKIMKKYPWLQLYAATTSEGCYRNEKNDLIPSGIGKTFVGKLVIKPKLCYNVGESNAPPPPPAWFEFWQHGIENVQWSYDMDRILLEKLLINCVINPLTALRNIKNGELLHPHYITEYHQALDETSRILHAIGYNEIALQAYDLVTEVVKATSTNTSSMCADILSNRRTEVDYILGYLLETLKISSSITLSTPLLDSLLQEIRELDKRILF